MMQGDACSLGFTLRNNAGSPVTPEDVLDVEITMGGLCKSLRREQLIYHEGRWLFPLSQGESLRLWPGATRCQVRVLWRNGVVEGKPIYGLSFRESISREVLT